MTAWGLRGGSICSDKWTTNEQSWLTWASVYARTEKRENLSHSPLYKIVLLYTPGGRTREKSTDTEREMGQDRQIYRCIIPAANLVCPASTPASNKQSPASLSTSCLLSQDDKHSLGLLNLGRHRYLCMLDQHGTKSMLPNSQMLLLCSLETLSYTKDPLLRYFTIFRQQKSNLEEM